MFRSKPLISVSESSSEDFASLLSTHVSKYSPISNNPMACQTSDCIEEWCEPKDAEVFSRLGLSTPSASIPNSRHMDTERMDFNHTRHYKISPYSSSCGSICDAKERLKNDRSVTTAETADFADSSPISQPVDKSDIDLSYNAIGPAPHLDEINFPRSGTEPSGYFKLLVSQIVAGSIIGRQGAEITAVQEKCSVRIKLSGNKDFYPGTHDRIVYLRGSLPGVTRAMRIIIARLKDEALTTALSFGKNPDPAEEIAFNLKMIIPKTSVGVLIGKSGFQVKEIQRITGATILILKEVHGAPPTKERVALISGTEQTIEAAACILVVMLFKCNSASVGSLSELDSAKFDWEAIKTAKGHQSDQLLMTPSAPEICQVNRAEVMENLLWALTKRSDISEFVTCVDMQMPTSSVGMIIGTGGRSINDIQTKSGTRIQVSAKDDLIPGTTNRKLTVTGTVAGIFNALCQVVERLLDQSAQLPPKGIDRHNQPENTPPSRFPMQLSQGGECGHSFITHKSSYNSTFPIFHDEENNTGMADIIQATHNRRCMMFNPMPPDSQPPNNSGAHLKIIKNADWVANAFNNA